MTEPETTLQPQINPETPESELTQNDLRMREIVQQKRRYKTLALIGKICLAMIGITIAGIIIAKIITNFLKEPFKSEPQQVEEKPLPRPDDSWFDFLSEELKVSFKYPQDAVLDQYGVQKIVTGDEDNLVEGYVFKITPLIINNRSLEEIAETKKQGFKTNCLPTANITSAVGTVVDSKVAISFEVYNCDPNYKITYYMHEGLVYEVAQVYDGDVGVEQKYRSETDEIFNSLKVIQTQFTDEELSDSYTYKSSKYRLEFKYLKSLDTTCCTAPAPPNNSLDSLISAYIVSGKGYGVLASTNTQRLSFQDFVNLQKTLLTEDFRVVRGTDPNGLEENLTVGDNYTAIKLSGYSWQNNDLIYIDDPNSDNVIVISISNPNSDDLTEAVASTLSSLAFTK